MLNLTARILDRWKCCQNVLVQIFHFRRHTVTAQSSQNDWIFISRNFRIGPGSGKYTLHVSGYSGSVRDAFSYSNNAQFSTKDAEHGWSLNCASDFEGSWWFQSCGPSNMNGNFNEIWWFAPFNDFFLGRLYDLCCSEMKIYKRLWKRSDVTRSFSFRVLLRCEHIRSQIIWPSGGTGFEFPRNSRSEPVESRVIDVWLALIVWLDVVLCFVVTWSNVNNRSVDRDSQPTALGVTQSRADWLRLLKFTMGVCELRWNFIEGVARALLLISDRLFCDHHATISKMSFDSSCGSKSS